MKKKSQPDILTLGENVYRTFFENSLDAILITLDDGTILDANSAACKMFGWTRDELLKMGRAEIAEQTPQLFEAIRQRRDKGKFFGELTYIRKDSTRFPVELSSSFFINYDGREIVIIIARDITERKKTEKALIESEERLRLASKAAGLGTYSYEFDSGKAFYSDEFLAFYGLVPGETLELDSDLIPKALLPEDRSKFLSAMSLANDPEGNGILDIEFRIISRNGEMRWLKSRGLTVFSSNSRHKKPLYANGVVQDITIRKKEEEKINELSERCRLITEYSGLGIGYYAIDGTILLFNEEALKNLGGKSDDYIGKNVVNVFGKEAGETYIKRFRQAAESEIPIQFEDNVELNGRPGWYLSTHTRILNKNGAIDGIHVIAENISNRKLAELAFRQNEEQLNLIFSTMSEGVALNEIIYDAEGKMIDYRILQVNDAFYKVADYKKNTPVIGNTATEIYGMSGESITDWWKKHISSDKTVFSEYLSPLNNLWYNISTSPFSGNMFVTTFTDISERKKAEELLSASSRYARTLLEASLDPLVTINSEGKITDVNLATEKVTGFKREKLIGSDFADYFIETEKAREGYNLVFSRGEVKNYALTIRHRTGRTTEVLYNATVYKNEEGAVQGVFAAARDITIRKKIEAKLKKSKKLLEKLNHHLNDIRENERSEIALNLHDDLGQRLTALCLDVAWIRNRIGVQSAAVTKKFEEMIHEINDTIDGIRELSSFLRPAILYDLGLVPAVLSQLKKFENQTGIICDFYFDSEEFNDDEKISLTLYRVIQESLTNIVRHSKASAMEVTLKKLRNAIELVVSDNGIGIDIDKINSLSSMGLEGIKERVKSAHGEVSIMSKKGLGTTIKVKIPIKKN
jgi:PAS domain S-box-containing protein